MVYRHITQTDRIGLWPPPYPSVFLQWLDILTEWLRFPLRRSFDEFLSCFFFTTVERNYPLWQIWVFVVMMPFWLICLLLSLPTGIVGCALWFSFRWSRRNYLRSRNYTVPVARLKDLDIKRSHICSFATTNLNLLPECIARYNNFTTSHKRGQDIAAVFVSQQRQFNGEGGTEQKYWDDLKAQLSNRPIAHKFLPKHQRGRTTLETNDVAFDTSILSKFPPVDILMIQEGCWDDSIGGALVKELHKVYPEIVYDAGEHSYGINKFVANSGLIVASKYEILDVEFRAFEDFLLQDIISSKGLLQLMVSLGRLRTGEQLVGYVANTHLQAHQGTNPVHTQQLQSIIKWTQDFRERTSNPKRVVLFDVVAGDFNLDNLSPVDERDWYSSLFNVHYRDLGRKGPGQEQPWAVGTEMRLPLVHDKHLSTPEALKATMQIPDLCARYFLAGNIESANLEMARTMPPVDEQGNYIPVKNAGKRRIDYLLYKESDGAKPLAFSPVTQLANLTDHIPYTLALRLDPRKLTSL